MKPNELRIGNLIHHNSENAKSDFIGHELTVLELTEKSITTFYIDLYGSRQIVRNRENYQPIPLTEGWLLKFGFVDTGSGIYNFNGTLILHFKRDDEFSLMGYNSKRWQKTVVLKYIHQLQNIYFALTGEELTLKYERI